MKSFEKSGRIQHRKIKILKINYRPKAIIEAPNMK